MGIFFFFFVFLGMYHRWIGRNDVCSVSLFLKGEEGVNLATCPSPYPSLWMGNFIGISMCKGEMDWRRIGGLSVMCKKPKPKPDVSYHRPT
ncbi:hypothetical protein LI328DRAFT_137446 [Trichoderma asperelloides]|nr:hypothetical protein LI328DRAFT_137446 [Trichoderma asperelloides]